MILPATYSEKEILSELIGDYFIVKKFAKKIADAYLLKAKKSGRFIRDIEYNSYSVVKQVPGTCFIKWNKAIKTRI